MTHVESIAKNDTSGLSCGASVLRLRIDAPARIVFGDCNEGQWMKDVISLIDKAQQAAARRAAAFVEPGMKVGLGSGSIASWLIECLGQRVREEGLHFEGLASSARTADLASAAGLRLVSLDAIKWLDLAIDGADEVDGAFNFVKGHSGAFWLEKVIAAAADRMVVVTDESRQVTRLGGRALPVEVLPKAWQITRALVEDALVSLDVPGRRAVLRMTGSRPFMTAQGNYVLDLHLRQVAQPHALALVLNQIPGVVENGLFLDICDTLVLGDADGCVAVRNLDDEHGTVARDPLSDPHNLFVDLDGPAGPS